MVLESMKEETCTKINLRLALTFTLGAGKSRRSSYSKVFFFRDTHPAYRSRAQSSFRLVS